MPFGSDPHIQHFICLLQTFSQLLRLRHALPKPRHRHPHACFDHPAHRARAAFKPEFRAPEPLQKLGLTPREAEVLFWVAQGKTNAEIALILDMSAGTVKKHMEHILPKIGVENRAAFA